jgi:ABC-2 type transport system permease protein
MRTLAKYSRLLGGFFRTSAIADLEFRLNIAMKILTDIIWYIAQLSVFEVLFRHVPSFAGWTLESTRVFMGVLFLTDAIYMMLFSENLDRFSEKVRRGDLDLLLTKPVNSQFMISFQRFNTAYIGNVLIASSWLLWALWHLPGGVTWWRLLLLIFLVPSAVLIGYCMRFFFSACALIFTRAEYITYIWFQLYKLATRPDSIYPVWLRYAVLTIMPVAFMASVPARMILNEPDPLLFLGSLVLPAIFLFLTTRFWRFALRQYASASS